MNVNFSLETTSGIYVKVTAETFSEKLNDSCSVTKSCVSNFRSIIRLFNSVHPKYEMTFGGLPRYS